MISFIIKFITFYSFFDCIFFLSEIFLFIFNVLFIIKFGSFVLVKIELFIVLL